MPEWFDRLLGSDPGMLRLMSALQATATIAGAILAEWLFVGLTHALQTDTHGAVLPPAQAALVASQHHGVLIVAIMLGAILAMMGAFNAAMFPGSRAMLTMFAMLPVPALAGISLGLTLAPYRVVSLASFVVILVVGAYCRRFGPRGFVGGLLLFLGDFLGFFLHREITISGIGWLAVEVVIGTLVGIIAQFTLFYPSRRLTLTRIRRSYTVRAREVATAALNSLDEFGDTERAARRLHQRLIRLNEAALMIDARLSNPGTLPDGWSASVLHQLLFDSELAVTNMARFAVQLSQLELPAELRAQVRGALSAVANLDLEHAELAGYELLDRGRELLGARTAVQGRIGSPGLTLHTLDATGQVVLHRFAISVLGFIEATRQFQAGQPQSVTDTTDTAETTATSFTSPVVLAGGWLPGSAMVSAAASLENGPRPRQGGPLWRRIRLGDRVRLAPYTRVAIQLGVAVTGALLLGDLLSGQRFYWAVIAAFVAFMGAHNAGEQIEKGVMRIVGTFVGVLLGTLLAHLVGQRTDLAITVILVSMFLGLYLMRINYAFMVVGVTIMVAQLYVQLDEFSNSLLVLRLEETAIGAAVAAVTVLLVFPLHTGRVARVAVRNYLRALEDVVALGVARMTRPPGSADAGGDLELRPLVRRLDMAYQTLVATMTPLRLSMARSADAGGRHFLQHAAASRHYARNLLIDTGGRLDLPYESSEPLAAAGQRLTASLDELAESLHDHEPSARTYVRSASLFDVVATGLPDSTYTAPAQLALRDFQLIDAAMAALADSEGLSVVALDTSALR